MKKMHRYISMSFLCVAALFLALNVSAHPQDGGRMAEKLGLSEVQKEAVQALRVERRQFRKTQQETKKAVHALIKSGDTEAAASQAAEQARARVHALARFRAQMKEILSPEQFEKWETKMEKRAHARGGEWRHKKRRKAAQ